MNEAGVPTILIEIAYEASPRLSTRHVDSEGDVRRLIHWLSRDERLRALIARMLDETVAEKGR